MRSPIQWLRQRAPFTTVATVGAALLLGLIGTAIWDSVTSARASSHRVYESTLSAELSNFLLSVREPDGSSLLDNPEEFSSARRALKPITLRRTFYSYLLNRANARSFAVEKLTWDPPRPCVLEFDSREAGFVLVQACVAVTPDETAGRFVYFFFRYPTKRVERHHPGGDLAQADRLVLNIAGDRATSIILVFQPPTLAASRYPSQMNRFTDIHELTAFSGGANRPIRQVNAQAFEKVDETGEPRNFVTIVGRVDAAILADSASTSNVWPDTRTKSLKFGFEIFSGGAQNGARLIAKVAPGETANAVDSLQKAYLSSVTSGSGVRVARFSRSTELVWTSDSLDLPRPIRRTGWTQTLSDWWAPKLMRLLSAPLDTAPVEQRQHYSAGTSEMLATIKSTPERLPDIATRAFGWLSAAFILVLLLVAFGTVAVFRLLYVTRSAWAMTINKNYAIDKQRYAHKRDEISTLGRLLNMLLARSTSRNAWIRKQTAAKDQELQLMQVHLTLRHDRLDAIGHEIRSPLQSLLIRTEGDEALQNQLKRMQRAVETLFQAESVEDGINSLEVVPARTDVAAFLSRLVANKLATHPMLRYDGPSDGVFAHIDGLQFELVIDHLIDNAERYMTHGHVVVSLDVRHPQPLVSVSNNGALISTDKLEMIFKYRNTDKALPRNRGLGLYAARSYLFAMRATIKAENHAEGVSMIMTLQPA